MGHIEEILKEMPKWREERLPPPRVSQSEVGLLIQFLVTSDNMMEPQYDKVGLTCKSQN